jgi:transcription antitermination factor NusG
MQEQLPPETELIAPLDLAASGEWYALQTLPRHEKRAAAELETKSFVTFLPLHTTIRQWSDRKQQVRVPLFPNYVFVRLRESRSERAAVLRTTGVRCFVGSRGAGVQIPHREIDAVQRILSERIPFKSHPFLPVGQRVRIRGGSLEGVQGIFQAENSDRSLIVSVECIQRSLSIRIDGYGVDPV